MTVMTTGANEVTEERRCHGPALFNDHWDPKRGKYWNCRDGCAETGREELMLPWGGRMPGFLLEADPCVTLTFQTSDFLGPMRSAFYHMGHFLPGGT